MYRVGVIGLGLMGERMIGALANHPKFQVVAGFDPDASRCAEAAEQHGFLARGTEPELLAADDLDLVYIASPPSCHRASSEQALARQLPVFVEKPLAASITEAEALVEFAKQHDTAAAMHFPFATLLRLPAFRDFAKSTVLRVEIELHFSQWPRTWHHAGPWLQGPQEGGFLREVFSHFAYLTQCFVGPLAVQSSQIQWEPDRGCESLVSAVFHAAGVPVTLVGGVGGKAPDFNRWTLYTAQGCLRVEDWARLQITDGDAWRDLEIPTEAPRGLPAQLDELDNMLAGRSHGLATLEDGLNVVRCVESLLEQGAKTGLEY